MRRPHRVHARIILALFLITVLALPGPAVDAQSPSPGQRLLVDAGDNILQAEIARLGGQRLVDYGAFSLWQVPPGRTPRLAGPTARATAELDFIRLRTRTIDTRTAPARLANGPDSSADDLSIVQFVGPVKAEWLSGLVAAGLDPVGYLPNNAYLVRGDVTRVVGRSEVRWINGLHPNDKISPALTGRMAGSVVVLVELLDGPNADDSVNRLRSLASRVRFGPSRVGRFVDIAVEVSAERIAEVATWPNVIAIEPFLPPGPHDEIQGQILAGNLISVTGKSGPGGPGYLAWLSNKGFPTDPALYPLVDVIDSGIEDGTATPIHADFYEFGLKPGPDRLLNNDNCTSDPTANDIGGHGTIVAGIIAGYNVLTTAPHRDGKGFQRDLGIVPYGRVAGTKIFTPTAFDTSGCFSSSAGVVTKSWLKGAQISSNSWGANTIGFYTALDRDYDLLTRDASNGASPNVPMLHLFSVGNAGPGNSTTGSPSNAKNVISVGASESVRDNGVLDGCNTKSADSADDLLSYTSRGPTRDGRAKPDLVAPGVHIQGPASQIPGFTGTGVCGTENRLSPYYPVSQTLYSWSSGTSYAVPAVSGAAALAWNWYTRTVTSTSPSPAMLKALLINSARYLTGQGGGDTLPSPAQGWGAVDLGQLIVGPPRIFLDQTQLMTATGSVYTMTGRLADPARPFRVTLDWTDAFGSVVGDSYVNDLDLEVTVGGLVYRGNVFSGRYSVPGGSFDPKNNVENVFLPAGLSGGFQIRVIARNLAGDGVPANASPTDQDFALVVSNAESASAPLVLTGPPQPTDLIGNGNGIADPGETIAVSFTLTNAGGQSTVAFGGDAFSGTLIVVSGAATVLSGTTRYLHASPGSATSGQVPYRLTLGPANCDDRIVLGQRLEFSTDQVITLTHLLPLGNVQDLPRQSFPAFGSPLTIPDNDSEGVTARIAITTPGTIVDLAVRVSISHTYAGDLVVNLIAPNGKMVPLVNRRGGSGDHLLNTTFADSALIPIGAGAAPFVGSFQPESPLAVLAGEVLAGTWSIVAADLAFDDLGLFQAAVIEPIVSRRICAPYFAPVPTATPSATPSPSVTAGPGRYAISLPVSAVATTGW